MNTVTHAQNDNNMRASVVVVEDHLRDAAVQSAARLADYGIMQVVFTCDVLAKAFLAIQERRR